MTVETARAFWVVAANRGEIREQRLPRPRGGEACVRTRFSAISRGTETLVFAGRVPESEFERMRAPFQEGHFPAPVKYGYINVGVVESGPAGWPGRHVFCLYPHQTRFVVPTSQLLAIPRRVPAERAVLAANLETALNALWDARITRGSRLTVIGAGALGCLCAWLARHHYGADAELVDINPDRAGVAARLGVAFADPQHARAESPLVIHTSATEAGLETALGLAGFEAQIIELSWYGRQRVALPLGEAFHSRRLTLKASQVGHVARPMRGHMTHRSRLQYALRLLEAPLLDCLIDAQSHFEELPVVLDELTKGERDAICHRIVYSEQGD
ncbi:MAG: zinc-binding alcohol dehydrogenase [Gammaproteobacteria bacterium]